MFLCRMKDTINNVEGNIWKNDEKIQEYNPIYKRTYQNHKTDHVYRIRNKVRNRYKHINPLIVSFHNTYRKLARATW
jgi:hypothetical protein